MEKLDLYLPQTTFQIGKNSTTWDFLDTERSFFNNKLRMLLIQQASITRNSIKKADEYFVENDIKVTLKLSKIKQLLKIKSVKNKELIEEFQSMEGRFFVKSIEEIEKNTIKATISRGYFKWKDQNSLGFGKDFKVDLLALGKIKSFKAFFIFCSVKYYGNARFINLPLLKHLGCEHSTPEKIKTQNKKLRELCERLGFRMTKDKVTHLITITNQNRQPETKKNEEKTVEAVKPKKEQEIIAENEPQRTESEETGFNRLIDWQEALKPKKVVTERNYPPLPDFIKEANDISYLLE
ncbi:TPA: hypothetical protein NGT56_000118 [Vibrio parahaemolyticus]|nr:hypothetical protein [Vibrio parahaemolyticus]